MKTTKKNKTAGFTLIEILISIAIVSILAGIAYPSYVDQVKKSRRSDGHLALMNASQELERCKSATFTYVGCKVITSDSESQEKFYKLSLNSAGTSSFTISAIPQNTQSGDSDCGTLTINHKGVRTASGASDKCW